MIVLDGVPDFPPPYYTIWQLLQSVWSLVNIIYFGFIFFIWQIFGTIGVPTLVTTSVQYEGGTVHGLVMGFWGSSLYSFRSLSSSDKVPLIF